MAVGERTGATPMSYAQRAGAQVVTAAAILTPALYQRRTRPVST